MPKWTYSITIINNTDRKLELVSSSIPWGKKSKPFPQSIDAGATGEFMVYSPAGKAYGLEFYFSMRDKPEAGGESSYGSFSFSVDMPYWKHANKSELTCTGMLTQSGFKKVPDGAHDFATTATISTTLTQKPEAPDYDDDTEEYNNRYDWDAAEKLDIVNPDDVDIDSLIPAKNVMTTRKTVLRTEQSSVSKSMWNQIKDSKYPESHNKKDFVSDYFTVMIYELRKNKTISIAANQSYDKTIEITNRSTVRRETREELQIENVINGSGGPEKITLSETLRIQYQISNLYEYCEENMETVREEFIYDATDYDRNVVLWDLAQVLALYRKDKKGRIELIGVDDYYLTDMQKTYISGDNSDTSEIEFECANSQEVFNSGDEILTTIQGSVTINGRSYRWMEIPLGTNRGMAFNPGNHRYKFNPNPHRDPYYNKHQIEWYSEMANAFRRIGNTERWTADSWPHTVNGLVVNGKSYTAEP